MQETEESQVQSLGWEDPLGRKWNLLQYSCLENLMDRGAWWAIVHGVAKSWTGLSDWAHLKACILVSSPVQSLSPVQFFATPWTCSTLGFPVHHQLPELAQTHVLQVSDAIQLPHPLSSPSPPACNLSQHQGLFPRSQFFVPGGQSIGASTSTPVLPMNIQD